MYKITPELYLNTRLNIYFNVYAFADGELCRQDLVQVH